MYKKSTSFSRLWFDEKKMRANFDLAADFQYFRFRARKLRDADA